MSDWVGYRKIKSKERVNGMRYCTFCKPDKIDAVYRNIGKPIHAKIEFACADCVNKLTIYPKPKPIEREDKSCNCDEHLTEADYQTWMRL